MSIPVDPTGPSGTSTTGSGGLAGKITTSGRAPATPASKAPPASTDTASSPGPVAAIRSAVDMTNAARDVLGMAQSLNYSGVALPSTDPAPITAEPGQTTSEYLRAYLPAVGTTGVALVLTLLGNHAHFLNQADLLAIGGFVGAVDLLAVSYIIGRSVRKKNTQG